MITCWITNHICMGVRHSSRARWNNSLFQRTVCIRDAEYYEQFSQQINNFSADHFSRVLHFALKVHHADFPKNVKCTSSSLLIECLSSTSNLKEETHCYFLLALIISSCAVHKMWHAKQLLFGHHHATYFQTISNVFLPHVTLDFGSRFTPHSHLSLHPTCVVIF